MVLHYAILGADPDFLKMEFHSGIATSAYSCKSKTRKKVTNYLLTIAALHLSTNYILFITTYIACYAAPQKNTVTALLEYLDLDCSIRVSQIRGSSKRGLSWNSLNSLDLPLCTAGVKERIAKYSLPANNILKHITV